VFDQQQEARVRELAREVRSELGPPTARELEQAREYITAHTHDRDPREFMQALPVWVALGVPAGASLLWGFGATVATLIAGCGLSFRIAGLRLRTRRGTRASRLRYILRSALTWGPPAVTFGAALTVFVLGTKAVGVALAVLGALGFLVGLVYTVLPRVRSLQDRIAGTRIVPL
jgi:hypothetical protein